MSGTLIITDGTTRIDLLDTFKLTDWTPATAAPKGGGVWRDSPFLQGRQLVLREYDNIIDTFDLKALGGGSHDVLIYNTQELRRLLEKAVAYWVTDWQNEPVWIETRGLCETNTRYAIIQDYRTPNDDNPFDDPYFSGATFDDWTLILEHGLWLDQAPGSTSSLEIGATETYDGRNLGNVDDSGVFTPTTAAEVYVANKHNIANLTDIYAYDASGPSYSANLMDAALPFQFLPAAPALGDIVYFGIDTSLADSGRFCSLVFDISTAQSGLTIEWEYWNGAAWVALTLKDNTNSGGAYLMPGDAFDTTGVWSVHWSQPIDWATTTVNAITGWWVRARVTAAAAGVAPIQQNRDIYSVVWPYVDIDTTQITGDLGYLIDHTFRNFSSGNDTELYSTRMVLGSRSLSRGENFTAYINLSDSQNQSDITINAGSFADYYRSPTGRAKQWTTGGAIVSDQLLGYIKIDTPLCDEYTGSYRLFVRGFMNNITLYATIGNSVYTNVIYRTETSDEIDSAGAGRLRIADLGQITIDARNKTGIFISIYGNHLTTDADVLYFTDIILMPVDEFVIDAFTKRQLSGASSTNNNERNGFSVDDTTVIRTHLETKAASVFKRTNQAELLKSSTDQNIANFTTISNGKMSVNANTDIRLWHLSDIPYIGDPIFDIINCAAEVVSITEVAGAAQYLGMRGDR